MVANMDKLLAMEVFSEVASQGSFTKAAEKFSITPTMVGKHIKQLEDLEVQFLASPEDSLLLLQTGDETLDYREAADYYAASACHVEQGGDHSFCHFENWLPAIAQFLEIDSHE